MGGGNDSIRSGLFINNDSVDMGAGDDTVGINNRGSTYHGGPVLSTLNMTKLDGGSGIDTLSVPYNEGPSIELTLTLAGATNFENILGSGNAEVIRGDAGANVLSGNGGADTIYGGGGNDFLGGERCQF